jgi:cytochrome c oxidase subunit 2
MPTYQGQISEDGLIDLVEYLKQLNSNYRVQQTLGTQQSEVTAPATTGMPAASGSTGPAAPGMVKP